MKNQKYDGSSIQVLEGLEAVRKRPGMYIGNVDQKGYHHLVWEIVDNAIDEVLADYANEIKVKLHLDGAVTISDDGRGIPIDIHPKTQKSAVETVFTVLHAGGKFGGDNSGYKVSGGLHGVGASVVNALSDFVEIQIYKDGFEYELIFNNGGRQTEGLKKIGPTKQSGTSIKFKPSKEYFNKDVLGFDIRIIKNRLKEIAFLNKGLTIEIEDENDENENAIYKFEGGIIDFVKDINKSHETINTDVIYGEQEKGSSMIEVAFQYTSSYQSSVFSFVNNIATIEHGTHIQGFFDALIRVFNKYAKDKLPQKEQVNFKKEDMKEGLTAIISIKHTDPIYEGQTKNKFVNQEVRKHVNDTISDIYQKFLYNNPSQATQIINKIKLAAKSRVAALKAKEITRRKDVLGFSSLPGKLADCSSKNRADTEIFIVEGDSAGGSAKMGRDREKQAILPLKGKVINAERTRIDKLLSNDEITSMITAFGANFGEEFDIEKLRYDKIIIMTDADVDGSHIRTLILTFFFRHFKQLIENGNVYIAQSPLFKIWKGKKIFYAYTDEEKNEIFSNLGDELNSYSIQRYKGLGEMNEEQLWETTMDPENRKLIQVEIGDMIEAEKVFSNLMGEVVEPRRHFIVTNSKFADLDI